MAIVTIGIGLCYGAQVNGAQYGPHVVEAFLTPIDIMINQDETIPQHDHYLYTIIDVVSQLQHHSQHVLDAGHFPLVIGGDHALAMGSLPYKEDTLVVWIDAHGDVNTFDTTPSNRIHGMPMAALMGYGDPRLVEVVAKPYLDPSQVVFVGVRDLDDGEVKFIHDHKLMMIDHHQPTATIVEVLQQKLNDYNHIHISFDLDSLDPSITPGVSTPVADGLSKDMALNIVKALFESGKVRSMDIVEFNPLKETPKTLAMIEQLLSIVKQYKG